MVQRRVVALTMLTEPRVGCCTPVMAKSGLSSSSDDIRGPRLGDVGRQVREEFLQLCVVRGDRHVGGVRVAGPVVQGGHVDAVRANQADVLDDHARRPGSRGHGSRRRADGGHLVGEHHHHLVVGRGRSNRAMARVKAAAGPVCPPAVRPSTAAFRYATG